MFPSPACLATVAMSSELALPSIWSTTAGFRRLLFLSTWVDFAFVPGGICLLLQEMQETQVRSLGQEDPLEKDMATHSSVLA